MRGSMYPTVKCRTCGSEVKGRMRKDWRGHVFYVPFAHKGDGNRCEGRFVEAGE